MPNIFYVELYFSKCMAFASRLFE